MSRPPPRRPNRQRRPQRGSAQPQRLSSPSNNGVYVVKSGTGGDGGWIFASILLLVLAGGAFAYYFKTGRIPLTTALISQAGDDEEIGKEIEPFKLPEIISNPETEGERPILADASDFDDVVMGLPVDDAGEDPPEKPAAKPAAGAKPAELKAGSAKEANGTRRIVAKWDVLKPPSKIKQHPQDRTVDVLCLYTGNYKNRYGGTPKAILDRAAGMVNESNEIWQKKGVRGTLRMVGLVEVDYQDSHSLTTDLHNLYKGNFMAGNSTIAALRDKLGADMVCLLATKTGGGVSGGGPFCIVKRGHGIFTHEVQHNFGWGHKEQLPNGGGDDVMKLDSTYPGRAKWKPTVVGKDKIYLQYFEGKKPEPPKK